MIVLRSKKEPTALVYFPLAGLSMVPLPLSPPALYYSLSLVCCRYRALLVCLFFYSVDIPDGENPEFLIKCKTLHMQGEILEGLQATGVAMSPLQEGALTTPAPDESQWTEVTYVAKLEMCVTSSILSLTALLCFVCVSKPCTQMNDPAKEFLHAAQSNGLCGPN